MHLGKKTDPNTFPWPKIFPCMMDMAWYTEYLDGQPDEHIVSWANDPDGWGAEANGAANDDSD